MNRQMLVLKDTIRVGLGQGMVLLSGIATGLLLPKIFSIDGYGYFRIFTLYAAYTALLHFGFIDGILLKYAGVEYESLDEKKFRTYSRFFVLMQLALGAVMAIAGIFIHNQEYRFILAMLGADMVAINVTSYYQFISQATQRFKEYSVKNMIISVCKVLLVAGLFLINRITEYNISYRIYIMCIVALDMLMMIWYICVYRNITFGSAFSAGKYKDEIKTMMKSGILLTIAYQVSHIIHIFDRQFVSILYETSVYAVYAFAYNLLTLISTMISSLAIVMFPMLKKTDEEYIEKHYAKVLAGVTVLVGVSLVCYYPLAAFIEWFLLEYVQSLVYLKIVLPSVMFTADISVVMFTFCKVLDENFRFFKNSCIALAIGVVTNILAYMIFGTPISISVASLFTMACWFLIEGKHLEKLVKVKVNREFWYISILTVAFIANTSIFSVNFYGIITYMLLYLIITVLMYRKFIFEFLKLKNR